MRCNPGEAHWAGSVEDLDRCECNGDGTCNLCLIRENDGLVFTRVTGCYRSANSAIRALQQWAANPDVPPPPAPFNCSWTTMQAVLCENVPNAPAMPLGTTESIYLPSLPTPPADLCENNHAGTATLLGNQRHRAYSMPQVRPRAYLRPHEHGRGPTL